MSAVSWENDEDFIRCGGECYACLVGVSTGPESHSPWCPAASLPKPARVEHRIHISEPEDDVRVWWECSCGHSGSAPAHRADEASDRHIPEGDFRIDTSRPF